MTVAEEILRQEIRDVLGAVDLSKAARLAALKQQLSLKDDEVADLTSIPVSTLRKDRAAGIGIKFYVKGGRVYYRTSDVLEYMSLNITRTRDHE